MSGEPGASRLALGTAQFGLSYGVANVLGQVGEEAVRDMLRHAFGAGLRTLDTAIAYGNSEACLGRLGVSDWEVVTKLPPLPSDETDVSRWVKEQVMGSLARLGLQHLPVLLLHRPDDLLEGAGPRYIKTLLDLQGSGRVGAVGVSIYAPGELDRLWPVFRPAVVQAPLNVLDRRLVRSGWLARLNDAGVRVMARSAFLQGLLLLPRQRRPDYFRAWARLLDEWLNVCEQSGRSPLVCALGYALSEPGVDRVVVGADSLVQLEEIIAAASMPLGLSALELCSDDPDLVEPWRWRLQ